MNQSEPNHTFPLTLRESADRYTIVTVSKGELYILKSQKNSLKLAETVKKALNLSTAIYYETDSKDLKKLIQVELKQKYDLSALPCPDRPEFNREFWFKQLSWTEGTHDIVRWVTKSPNCKMYRVYFNLSAAVYFLHESHPNKSEVLVTTYKSINEARKVIYYTYQGFPTFICDMKFLD
jgi:hypothetical protein